ncbi:MAG: 4a-hydroxytetrahydrobiopterin dehydratase [Moraxella sp.]|nr:4a-hydroxytetrahydrobiopterin dehydratase [Moraxella sp.]
MTDLSAQSCTACHIDAPLVCQDQIPSLLSELDGWQLITQDDVQQLTKLYRFKNFKSAFDFASRLSQLAESVGHHPAILIEWGKVRVNWWSHSIKGLHRNDFIMAAKTDILMA